MNSKLQEAIKIGQPKHAPRILFIGVEGVGKTTIGNRFPNPLFLCAEKGLVGPEFDKTPNITPVNFSDMKDKVGDLIKEDHNFKTLVIDTVDWFEQMVFSFICKRDGKTNIEEYGYGKGYIAAADEWRHLLAGLEKLRTEKNMTVVFLAHCQIKAFNNPLGDNYDKYEMKVCKQIASVTKEWCDAVLFAQFKVYTFKESSKAKAKAVGTTERLVYTTASPAWDAKNRFGLPETLPLDYEAIAEAIASGGRDAVTEISEAIATLIDESEAMSDEKKEFARQALKRDSGDIVKLKTLLNKVKAAAE